jgi:DNA mismatch repair protein MutS
MLYEEATLSTPSLSERGANAVNKVCKLPNLFEQHAKLKSQYPGAILLMRVGDFYEAFDDDADTLARVLSLARTTRGQRRMAGFPHMQLDRFLTALVQAGFRVATAEPVFDGPLSGKPEVVRWNPCAEEGG